VVLVVLMMLSVLLATASTGTLVRLIGASSNLMEQADAPHVVQMHAGDSTSSSSSDGSHSVLMWPPTSRC
jgi:hypothetical protein